MARVSRNSKQSIVAAVREYMSENPNETVSMRRIAAKLGISAGTIYNHFSDKDSLIAALMLEDWHEVLKQMEISCEKAAFFKEGVTDLYQLLCGFISTYRNIWNGYRVSDNYAVLQSQRHIEIVGQIAVYVRTLLEKFAEKKDLRMDRILAENILSAAMQEEISLEILLQLAGYIA